MQTVKPNQKQLLIEKIWIQIALFCIITVVVYLNSFSVPFHFDDKVQIVNNNRIQSFSTFDNVSYWFNVNKRPVASFSLAINYAISGEHVFSYHLVNLLIHLITGVFLFLLLRLMFANENQYSKKYQFFPFFVVLFFLVHPAQTQAVTYLVQRMASLAGMFVVLSVYLYLLGRKEYFQNKSQFKTILYLGGAGLAGLLGVLSKQNAVVFPLFFLLVEFFFVRNQENKICKKYIISVLSLMLVGVVAYGFIVGLPYETKDITRIQYFASQMRVIPRYFQLMLFPIGLSIDHGIIPSQSFFELPVILGVLFIGALFSIGIFYFKKIKLLLFGIVWIFIALLVESSILPIRDLMFDHRMYLPIIGFGIGLFSIFQYLNERRTQNWFNKVGIGIIIVLSVLTVSRNKLWQSESAIWEKVTLKYPNHVRGWIGLGMAYVNENEQDKTKSINAFYSGYMLAPSNEELINDLAVAYMEAGQTEQSVQFFQKLINSKNSDKRLQALRVLGAHYATLKEVEKAEGFYLKILDENQNDEQTLSLMANLFLSKPDYDGAINYASRLMNQFPDNSEAYLILGKAHFYKAEGEIASTYIKQYLKKHPRDIDVLLLYANICMNIKEYDESISIFQQVYTMTKNEKIKQYIALVDQLRAQ